jgi:nucleotide-binding universal stress UspA family protein
MTYRIVVGVDGSEGGRRALTWAVREAALRGGAVHAVTAWRWDDPAHISGPLAPADQLQNDAEDVLLREVTAVPNRTGVTISTQAIEGRAAEVLGAATGDADVLVVGSHGHSRVRHIALGSVSEECVERAQCPVVILPALCPLPADVRWRHKACCLGPIALAAPA